MRWDDVHEIRQHWLLATMLVSSVCGHVGLYVYLWSRGELGEFTRRFLEKEFPTVGPRIVGFAMKVSEKKKGVSTRLKFLIDLFLPPDRAEETLMGLEDVYVERWSPRYGGRVATFICGCHVVATIVAFHWGRIVKLRALFGWPS